MAYENRHEFRDGRVIIYTRNNSPVFHMRLKIDGLETYVVRSTKQTATERAREVAEDLYDELRLKVKRGEDIGLYTFKTTWERWLKVHQNTLSMHRLRYIKGTMNRYLLPFFGDRAIGEINDKLAASYWDWRINYWSSVEGEQKIARASKTRTTAKRAYKQKLGNIARVPAQKSLEMERTVLGQVLGWANRQGIMSRVPEIKPPRIKVGHAVDRRPAFDLDEWKQLYRFFRTWVREGEESSGSPPVRGPNSFHRWHRALLRNYVLFMQASGLRPNEARQLRWRDVSTHPDKNGNLQTIIFVAPTTKTGERECIPLRNAATLLERLRINSRHTGPDDLIFADQNGDAIENFGKTFKQALIKANLLEDRFGRERTIYSLRHTYATFRLAYGNVKPEDLAQNMGTSPAIIYKHYRHTTTRQIAHVLGGSLDMTQSRKGLFL